ncbi:MAG: hypothetical protein AB7I18_12755 [Candidatus Berkiella sp.]
MMRQFGIKNEFGIDYVNWLDMYSSDPDVQTNPQRYETGGNVFLWVKDKNLFAFKGIGPEATYSANLNILLEYFCEKLSILLTDDPFPVATKATNAVDMMDEIKLIDGPDNDITKYLDLDWSKVDMEIRGKIDRWNDCHGIYTNRDGSFLPDLYIRKVKNQIEISWHNDFAHRSDEGEVYFEYEKGVEYVDLKLFKETVVAFCLDLINRFQKNYPEQMNRYRTALQRAIDLPV